MQAWPTHLQAKNCREAGIQVAQQGSLEGGAVEAVVVKRQDDARGDACDDDDHLKAAVSNDLQSVCSARESQQGGDDGHMTASRVGMVVTG